MHEPPLLMLGFGQLMRGVLATLDPARRVVAVSRHPPPPEAIGRRSPQTFRHVPGDLSKALPSAVRDEPFSQVLVCLSPSGHQESDYRQVFEATLTPILDGLSRHPPQHLFFVSSTSVYAQHQGEWVNEDSPTLPQNFSGRILLAAEQRFRAAGFPTTCIRFSGIYGGHRTRLLEGVRRGDYATRGPSAYTNRIHDADAVGVLAHLVERARQGLPVADCYLASDCEPAPLHEVAQWIRQRMALPEWPDHALAGSAQGGTLRRAGSKRCDNRRLLASGYVFRYPSYREGYARMIEDGA